MEVCGQGGSGYRGLRPEDTIKLDSKIIVEHYEGILDTYLESHNDKPLMEILDHLLSEEVKNQKSE